MNNPFKIMDKKFEWVAQDPAWRFFCCHLPFWLAVYAFSWLFISLFGIQILFFCTFCILPSYVFARLFKGQFIQKVLIAGAATLLVLVGIPGLYFGLLMKLILTVPFTEFYLGFIRSWWTFFNLIWIFSFADIPWGLYFYENLNVQILFLCAGLVLPYFMCILIPDEGYILPREFTPDEERVVDHENALREEGEDAARRELETKEEARKQALSNAQLEAARLEALALQKARAEEKSREEERQKRIKAVKDKDPWGSGFL